MKRILAREEVCIGCRLCEIHCLTQHSQSKDVIKAFKEEMPRSLSRVLVEEKDSLSFALQCRHCADAPCASACITGAMYIDKERGVVAHDAERCIGCWTCIMACPYGAIQKDETRGKIASKCDLCPDLETPACVANCPNEALTLVVEEEAETRV